MEPQNSSQQPLPPGTQLDAYQIQGVLGTGGFGVTYEAIEPELDRKVAIKEYFPESFAARQTDGITLSVRSQGDTESYVWGLTRFLDEARTLAKFKNPHIVRVNRYLEANGTAYLVMDYEDGYPLSAVLKKRCVGERSVRKLMVPILKGLKAVHEQKFLHRDIKPGNIFIRRDGPPLLIDFGAARQALQQKAAAAMTVILTPGYAPLEQYGESEDQQGPWTDLYAFGATLFHCLTGRPPRDAAWRIQASAHGVPDSIREALNPPTPLCSPEMVDLLCWMLMPLAKDRPQNCDQVAVRLYEMSKSPAGATIGGNMRSNPGHAISSATLSEVPRTEQAHPESRYYADGAGPATRFPTTSSNTDRASSGVPSTSSAPSASSIAPADAAAVEHALTEHLGPIARVLVKKAIAKATSRQDFVDGLAAEIDDISDREHFLAALKK